MDDGDRLRSYFISGNPFLDIARGTATVAAGIMLGREVYTGARSLFIAKCDCCRGTGRLVCPVCQGFNRLRRWPGEFHAHRGAIVNQRKTDEYPCTFCGPATKYDLGFVPQTDGEISMPEVEALEKNKKAAIVGRTRGMKKSPVLAGCIPCAKCRGAGEKRRTEFDVFSPFMQGLRNFQGPSWVPKAGSEFQTASQLDVVPHNATRRRSFRELPRRPVYIEELDEAAQRRKAMLRAMTKADRIKSGIDEDVTPDERELSKASIRQAHADLRGDEYLPFIDEGDSSESDDEAPQPSFRKLAQPLFQ